MYVILVYHQLLLQNLTPTTMVTNPLLSKHKSSTSLPSGPLCPYGPHPNGDKYPSPNPYIQMLELVCQAQSIIYNFRELRW